MNVDQIAVEVANTIYMTQIVPYVGLRMLFISVVACTLLGLFNSKLMPVLAAAGPRR